MADDETKSEEEQAGAEHVPVEQWIPHPDSDYVDWMDKEEPVYQQAPDEAEAEPEAKEPEK